MTRAIPLDELAGYRRDVMALEEWTDLQTLRSVHDALERRIDQTRIARTLGISQPAVSKIAKRARLAPHLLQRSPREVILERAIGRIDDQAMLDELCAWRYSDGHFNDAGSVEPESYGAGTFDQVTGAVGAGLLTTQEYEAIVRARADRAT
ncbi:MAG TPA: LysR family transcriptional regulator [Nakamurella sp.]